MNKIGKVVLIGAGPGDRGLLTIKGADILKKAEVVVYDRLVSKEILDMAPAEAVKINVGKEADHHNIKQSEINKILLDNAMAGKFVVRLKGGDPFLFGRGAEELELLKANGVPFEVIPGVTSPLAAMAYGGIPVTHRDYSSSVHIITGHMKEGGKLNVNFEALAALKGTLIFLMGVSTVKLIEQGLLSAGMKANTPAAIIENGTRENQRKIVTTLGGLADSVEKMNVCPPAVIAVGEVCALSNKFDWFNCNNNGDD